MAWNGKGKVTRRERFLAEMDAVIPWPRLVRLIEPHYPKAGQGRQPLGLERVLRIYFLQQWSICRTRRLRTQFTTTSRCVALRGLSWATRWCRTRPRFCAFATCWSSPSCPGDLRRDPGPAGSTAAVAALGNHRGRDHHRGAEFDQER
jgi:hypothetical protein